jgi:hypothetical protein
MTIELPIDRRNFLAPTPTLMVFKCHQLFVRPMKVISNKSHLLIELCQWIALYASPIIPSPRNFLTLSELLSAPDSAIISGSSPFRRS